MENEGKYFLLYANCILVKGGKKVLIYDLQYGRARFIPNLLYDILVTARKSTLNEIKNKYLNVDGNEIELIFKELKADSWGFFTKFPEQFPELNMSFEISGQITNAIIDIDDFREQPIPKIIKELNNLGCKALELRFYTPILISELQTILKHTLETRLKTIIIYLNYHRSFTYNGTKKIQNLFPRVKSIILYNAPKRKKISDKTKSYYIEFLEEEIKPDIDCGLVNEDYFTINYQFFLESFNYNNCLYKKISIDRRGYIKNCPSMTKHYGNIKETSLSSIVAKKEFQELWYIKKTDINVCKNCEFRYMCQDCRVFIEDKTDKFSKPSKCSYNPTIENLKQ